MSKVKLYYFDGRGLAEPIRLILSHAGVDFEDIRIPIDSMPAAIPPEIKEKCTWGQVPMLEFDGKKLCQSLAITRYVARKHNLVPMNLYEAALCDEYVDSIREFLSAWYAFAYEKDPEKKKEKTQEALVATKKRYLDVFESIVKANDGKHVVGSSITWADIYIAHGINHVELVHGVSLLDDLPALKNLFDTVFEVPGIKAWIDKRPNSKI